LATVPGNRWLPRLLLLLCLALFFANGYSVLPYMGIQQDEAIFTGGLFDNPFAWYSIPFNGKEIPLMVMTYLGATKTWLYAAVFSLWRPSVWSLRIPVLLLATASVWLFYLLLRRTSGERAAFFGLALLATDTCYLMTSVADWGPVVLQHLTLIGGLAGFLIAFHSGRTLPLAAGAFSFGFGMWDKALLVWMLSGIGVATVLLFHTELKRHLSIRRIMVTGFFFLFGALPLVVYNVAKPLETFRGNAKFSTENIQAKMSLLPATLRGTSLFGFLVEEDWPVTPRPPHTVLEAQSLAAASLLGQPRAGLNWYAFQLSLALTPVLLFTRHRRAVLFVLLTMAIAWGQMLCTRDAGGGVHHTILLWPFPLWLIAIAFTWISERLGRAGLPFLALSALLLAGSSLAVTNQYRAMLIRNGSPGGFTDAIFNLATRLPAQGADRFYLMDWGMLDNLRLLHAGRLTLFWGTDEFANPNPIRIKRMLSDQKAVFLTHTDERQIFPGGNARMKEVAAAAGFRPVVREIIYDFNGRPTFQILQFQRSEP
jgi:hypothetical protein